MEGVYAEVHKVKYQYMIPAMVSWSRHVKTRRQGHGKSTKMDCWDIWLDSSGHNCLYHMLTSRENKEENPEGPWGDALTSSGA
eukprot:12022787-Prorocentrum_lima.AAC.1